jgi:hypothetical protein
MMIAMHRCITHVSQIVLYVVLITSLVTMVSKDAGVEIKKSKRQLDTKDKDYSALTMSVSSVSTVVANSEAHSAIFLLPKTSGEV